jgi:hypothetical protein
MRYDAILLLLSTIRLARCGYERTRRSIGTAQQFRCLDGRVKVVGPLHANAAKPQRKNELVTAPSSSDAI